MKYIFATLFCLTSLVAHAQLQEYERRFTCGETRFVLSALKNKARETPIWVGHDPNTRTDTVVMLNTETLTWTVVQYDKEMACVLDSGEGFRILTNTLKQSQ